MGRGATVAMGNVWYEARIEASKGNEKLKSRFGAAEEAGMSEDAIKGTELGLEEHMPVDKAVILADLYNAPQLLNHYCLYECPIGRNRPISDELLTIEQIVIRFMKKLRKDRLFELKRKLVEIALDGEITKDEMEDLMDIKEYLDGLSKTISQFQILVDTAVRK